MAKFAAPEFKDSLLEEQLFERKKKDMASMKAESTELLKPDFSRTAQEVLGDIQYKGIVARALGREFEEREYISESDLQKLMMLSEINGNFENEVAVKLIPIMKRGRKWESKDSKRLRTQYIQKSHKLFEILSKFEFNNMAQSEEIFLRGDSIFDKTSAYLDFSSAAALVDKGPRKKKSTKASGSAYFREIYLNGARGALFALFDGFDERGFESLPSSLALEEFKERAKTIAKEEDILAALEAFAKAADARISEKVKGFCGTSATCGIAIGKKLYYVNIGNNRIYGITAAGETAKLAGDDVSAGQSGGLEELYSELRYPYFYLGGFTQRIKGKRSFRVIHTDFRLRAPYIGSLDVSKYGSIFVANSGVWKSAMTLSKSGIESGEGKFGEIFSRARNSLNAVERMNMHVKNSMKQAQNRTLIDDIAMLYFSI
ncbi:Uncharacterised protein [uncultured archaeon]|nr:Uncharacterised protein [uncultured archaeon]